MPITVAGVTRGEKGNRRAPFGILGLVFLTLRGLSDKLHLRGNLKGKRVKQFGL
jgi:hypothetical protein